MTTQLGLFEKLKVEQSEPATRIQVGRRRAQVPLRRKRREALKEFCALLDKLEGKDIWVGWCAGARSHFWLKNLKLERLQVERSWSKGDIPEGVINLWGRRGALVHIFTDQVISLRQQEYQGYTLWLLDFWNGFGEYPIDPYRPRGYISLYIVRFKD